MAFIEIKNEEKNIYKLLNLLRNEKFSVEVCNEILAKTNDFHVIKAMFNKINKLDIEEKKKYKDVIVSMFDCRLQREAEKKVALDIAKECGFEKELGKVIKQTANFGYLPKVGGGDNELLNPKNLYELTRFSNVPFIDFSSYDGIKLSEKIEEELRFNYKNGLKGVLDFRGASIVNFVGCDFSNVKKIIFGEGTKVCFSHVKGLPENLDVSMCSQVKMKVCDLQGIDLSFREGVSICLEESSNITRDLDVSMCSQVQMKRCDLRGINLAFGDGAIVDLFKVIGLPKDLDFSMCNEVLLRECDLSGANLVFRDGAKVNLSGTKGLPKDVDVSKCSYINFAWGNLSGIDLKFRDGAIVDFCLARSLPESLDLSMCKYVSLEAANLSNLKSIKLKNKKQWANVKVYEHDMENWEGEVTYVEKEFKLGNFMKNKIFGR